MTYTSLMVHMDLGAPNTAVLRVAGELAERFGAEAIGVAACQPLSIAVGDGYVPAELIAEDRQEIEKEIKAAKDRFSAELEGRARSVQWRSAVSYGLPTDYIAQQARHADLVITVPGSAGAPFDTPQRVSVSDLVMRAGRPVLIVPDTGEQDLGSALIGWKDTRETRRAVQDALPLLRQAGRVVVAEIVSKDELEAARARLDDVAAWLKGHDVIAETLALASNGDDAGRLDEIAREREAGLLVAGAYGHSRMREWAFGGVTRELLLRPARCTLLSH
ncbi:MAG TPA: universal stress protein [Aliidongia sp.]|nr:universal stress protein [Aliidongia sp.]